MTMERMLLFGRRGRARSEPWSRALAWTRAAGQGNARARARNAESSIRRMPKPTILLIHGAFGDASSWRPVFDRLDGDDYTVLAPPSPLRGVAADAAYTAAVIDQLEGPVVLVGHSYSGSVISVAGSSDKVAGLVYVAGFAPEAGESIADLQGRFPSLAMGNFLQPRPLPDGGAELSVDPDRFHDIFCADVPDDQAAFMAHSQRPASPPASEEPAATAAWRA